MSRPAAATVAALLLAAGCMTDAPPDAPAEPGPLRVLALGDSYTIGEGVAAAERWPAQLSAALRQTGLDVADPEIIAQTGWTVGELDAAIDRAGPRGPYALVTLLVGVNDQYRGHAVDGYRGEFRALLGRAIGLAGGDASRVVVVSIPDWGVTPFATGGEAEGDRTPAQIAREIDAFNAAARDEARAAGAAYVDVTALSRAQGDRTAPDGLHPDGAAYAAWTRRIAPAARAALGG